MSSKTDIVKVVIRDDETVSYRLPTGGVVKRVEGVQAIRNIRRARCLTEDDRNKIIEHIVEVMHNKQYGSRTFTVVPPKDEEDETDTQLDIPSIEAKARGKI